MQSSRPIYRTISEDLAGIVRQGKHIPSINETVRRYQVSKDTAVKAYNLLKKNNILRSVHGKGFFSSQTCRRERILFLLDNNNLYKENLISGAQKELGDEFELKIMLHDNKRDIALHILNSYSAEFERLLFIPPYSSAQTESAIKKTGKPAVLCDRNIPGSNFPAVYQNFFSGIMQSLENSAGHIKKYKKLVLLQSGEKNPIKTAISGGCRQFCKKHRLCCHEREQHGPLEKSVLYITVRDQDLFSILESARQTGMIPGKNFGLFSYNDTPFKKLWGNGISVISADFTEMGRLAAVLLKSGKKEKICIATQLILRST